MPKNITNAEELQQASRPLKDTFERAWSTRAGEWIDLERRQLMPVVPEHVLKAAEENPVLSPILEENVHADVQILTQQSPRISVLDQEGSDESSEDAEDARLYFEVQRNNLNKNNVVEAATARHFVWPDGVAVWRFDARKPMEFDGEETGPAFFRARDKHFRQTKDTWNLLVRNPHACYWWPLIDHKEFVEDVMIDFKQAQGLKRREDGMSAAEIIKTFPGVPEDDAELSRSGNVAHALFYEYEDANGDWWRLEYIYPMAGKISDGEQLSKSKLPHRMSSYRVLPSGSSDFTTTDPHRMYRPKLYTLGVMVERLNWIMTMKQAVIATQLTDKGVTLNLPPGALDEDGRRVLDRLIPGWSSMDGSGSDELMTAELPERNGNEILVIPGELRTFPGFQQVLLALNNDEIAVKHDIQRFETNPFLTGRAFAEYREGTGTANSLGTTHAAVPYGDHRKSIDAGWAWVFRAMLNCMLTWDEESEGRSIPYYAVSTMDTGRVKEGDVVRMDARKARRNVLIKVETLVETFPEKQAREMAAEQDLNGGHITFIDFLREKGRQEPRRYAFLLAKEAHEVKSVQESEAEMRAIRRIARNNQMRLNLPAILAMDAQLQAAAQGGGQMNSQRQPEPIDGVQPANSLQNAQQGAQGIPGSRPGGLPITQGPAPTGAVV